MTNEQLETLVLNLYYDRYDTIDTTYEIAEDLFEYIGYELESECLLRAIGVNGTSDLLDMLEKAFIN